MGHSKQDINEILLNSLKILKDSSREDISDETFNDFASYFYTPDQKLGDLLEKLKKEIAKREQKDPDAISNSEIGKLMEQVAYLTFSGLVGHSDIKSFQSAGAQYDLIITGDTIQWKYLCEFLFINNGSDFLIEVKAEKKRIGDPQFARLCSLLHFNLHNTSGLGIFFTLKGASGFPKPNSRRRKRSLSDARLRQAIFMASCNKPIIVFDENDIYELNNSGSLFQMLRDKIRDVEQLSGISIGPQLDTPRECDLPTHLQGLIQSKNGGVSPITKGDGSIKR